MHLVKELMTPTPCVVHARDSVEDCARRLHHAKARFLPITDDNGQFAGLITDFSVFANGELLQGNGELWVPYVSGEHLKAIDVVVPKALTAAPDDPVFDVMMRQLAERDESTVVVDKDNRPLGIICEHDMLALAIRTLPITQLIPDKDTTVYAVNWNQPAIDAWNLMAERDVRHVVVVDGDRIEGVVSRRDLLRDGVVNGRVMMAAECVRGSSIHVIAPGSPITEAAEIMAQHGVGSLPVVQRRRVVDIVTRTDVIRALLASLASSSEAH